MLSNTLYMLSCCHVIKVDCMSRTPLYTLASKGSAVKQLQ